MYYRVKTYPIVYQTNSLVIGSQIQPAISFPGWVGGGVGGGVGGWSESDFIS